MVSERNGIAFFLLDYAACARHKKGSTLLLLGALACGHVWLASHPRSFPPAPSDFLQRLEMGVPLERPLDALPSVATAPTGAPPRGDGGGRSNASSPRASMTIAFSSCNSFAVKKGGRGRGRET